MESEASEGEEPGFGALLRRHLDNGTRPDGKPGVSGKMWTVTEFADALGINERTVRNSLRDSPPPSQLNFNLMESALFGDNAAYDVERHAFRTASRIARATFIKEACVARGGCVVPACAARRGV